MENWPGKEVLADWTNHVWCQGAETSLVMGKLTDWFVKVLDPYWWGQNQLLASGHPLSSPLWRGKLQEFTQPHGAIWTSTGRRSSLWNNPGPLELHFCCPLRKDMKTVIALLTGYCFLNYHVEKSEWWSRSYAANVRRKKRRSCSMQLLDSSDGRRSKM